MRVRWWGVANDVIGEKILEKFGNWAGLAKKADQVRVNETHLTSTTMSSSFCSEAFVAIATPNLNETAKFYEALMHQPPEVFVADSYAEFLISGLKVGLFRPKEAHQAQFANPKGAPISLCLEVDDLEGAIAHLKKLGCPPPGEVQEASHGREIYAYDPDGNRLILHESQRQGE